jgi:hypothetical protein
MTPLGPGAEYRPDKVIERLTGKTDKPQAAPSAPNVHARAFDQPIFSAPDNDTPPTFDASKLPPLPKPRP